jgi:hypothetical protein
MRTQNCSVPNSSQSCTANLVWVRQNNRRISRNKRKKDILETTPFYLVHTHFCNKTIIVAKKAEIVMMSEEEEEEEEEETL